MSERVVDDARLWVLIESGSNQDFIFQSNRQEFQVGASALLRSIPDWVRDAADGVEPVVCTSSKALLLVDDRAKGYSIVEAVTRRALDEAPGLDIWGYVETPEDARVGRPMARLSALHRAHAAVRGRRPSVKLRFPTRPFSEICVKTGLPATSESRRPDRDGLEPVSATAAKVSGASKGNREWLGSFSPGTLQDRREELANAGWVAVVHADGNRVGEAILRLGKTGSVGDFAVFSTQLEKATSDAFKEACGIAEVAGRGNWLLPLIVGGDDVTFVCDARVAVPVVRAYLTAFERLSAGITGVSGHLTAAAGIAVVKPHYPFHAAYRLAEELARRAKRSQVPAPGRSAYDFHVLHDSIARPLDSIRSEMRAPGAAWEPWPDFFLAPPGDASPDATVWEDTLLLEAAAAIGGPRDESPLSGSGLHDLRSALLDGDAELDRTRARLLVNSRNPAGLASFIDGHHGVAAATGTSFSRLLSAMDLVDITRGVLGGHRAAREAHHTGADGTTGEESA